MQDVTQEGDDPTVVFGSLLRQLDLLRKDIENDWKLQRTDYEAFRQKFDKMALPLVPILDIVRLERLSQQPSSLRGQCRT